MTRIGHQNLTASNLTGVIRSPDRNIEYLVFYNNNPEYVYVRLGSPEIPNQRNFDIAVPPMYIMAISVNSNQFGIRLGSDNANTQLLVGNTVVEGMIDEAPPALGGVPIQGASLATSDLQGGVFGFSGVTTLGPFNLTLWGGALVYVNLGAGSGQAVCQVNASNSPAGPWVPLGTFALWPNVPSLLNVPRTVAFMQIIINATAIAGEPAIAGSVSVRAILSEVQSLAYNPSTQAITRTIAVSPSGSQQWQFVTVGLPAVSFALISTAPTGINAAITFLVEASSDLVNWRQVTTRNQRMSQGITLYRALGNLDLFVRVTVFETSGTTGFFGTLYLSIPPAADVGYILNTIQQSLGDPNDPINSNQNIYKELDSIRGALGIGNLTTLLTVLNNTISLGTNAALGAGNLTTLLTNTTTSLTAIQASQTRSSRVFTIAIGSAGGFVNQNFGVQFAANDYIQSALFSYQLGAIGQGCALIVSIGTAGGPVQEIYRVIVEGEGINSAQKAGQPFVYGSIRSPGLNVGNNINLWVSAQVAGVVNGIVSVVQ